MTTIKEVLRLKYLAKLSNRQIELLGITSRSAISNYTSRFSKSGLEVDAALAMSDDELSALLYPETRPSPRPSSKPHPQWSHIHNELKKKGMTRQLLWEEYREQHPEGLGITQFKEHYARYASALNPSMRQIHYAGDKLFVDFSGLTMPIHNAGTGEVGKAQIFVAVLGASGYTFVHAVESQSTESFIECHSAAFAFYGGVPNQVVPDNLKAAVISNTRGRVRLNASYTDMARHYGVALLPARPYHPQDKSKVEAGVKGIQRWILMKLRHRTFFDMDELNDAIASLLDDYNAKVIRRLGKSRTEMFESIDKNALQPLRANRYVYREHKRATVGVDYHVELDGSGYSVPYTHLGKKVDIWYSRHSVTISHQGSVIAQHRRCSHPHEDSTVVSHMPAQHQYQYEKWNPGRILGWAKAIGPDALALMQRIMEQRSHPVRGYRSCMAILSFSKTYGDEALELTCRKALQINASGVASIESILKRRTYLEESRPAAVNNLFNTHTNLRGSSTYR